MGLRPKGKKTSTTKTPLDPNTQRGGYSINPTPPNKATHRTRLNAYRHGLTGQTLIVTESEKKAFDVHCEGIVAALAPIGALEIDLAQAIAENRWRLKRIRAIEANIFAVGQQGDLGHRTLPREDPAELVVDEALSQAHTWLAKSDNFQLLALYEGRINRTVERNMAELRALRAERKAARDQALEEAQLLAQHAQSKGEKYDPAPDFPPELFRTDSDFSIAAITRQIDRNQRLN